MRAVFIRSQAILRDSHLVAETEESAPRLVPATLEAVRELAVPETMVVVYGHYPGSDEELPEELQQIISQVENAAGRIDIAVVCQHRAGATCHCWEDSPGILWCTATRFAIDLASSYLIGDCVGDVATAKSAGVRPILVLGDRTVEQVLGTAELQKDFAVAPDLPRAAEFITVEREIAATVGAPRGQAVEIPVEFGVEAGNGNLPLVVALSPEARQSQARRTGTRLQLGDITRWLVFLTVGGLGLSLGIAYLMTHLYRVQAFPSYVYYLTLQFISRPVRGAIFMAIGVLFVSLAVYSVVKSTRAPRDAAARESHGRPGRRQG